MYGDEEKKTYSIIGKVEIGTDEYRDLIEEVAKLRKENSDKSTELWQQRSRANDAETKLKAVTEDKDKFWAFINSTDNVKSLYRAWLAEEQLKAMKGDKE